jgi:hypothetical protein
MTTPKLKLHSLSDERPAPSYVNGYAKTILPFRHPADTNQLNACDVCSSDSSYIQDVANDDNQRFYVTASEVTAFLLKHNLLELPVTKEQQAYNKAAHAWVIAPESRNCCTPYYLTLREAFIEFHIKKAGYNWSEALYHKYCFN